MFRDMLTRVWVEAELLERVSAELGDSGYKALPFDPAQPPDRGVLIVRHAERAEALAKERIKLAVVAVLDGSELQYPCTAVADMVLLEWFPGELLARVARLSKQDAPGYRVHLLARAVEYAGDIIELGTTKAVLQYVNPAYTRVLGVSAWCAAACIPRSSSRRSIARCRRAVSGPGGSSRATHAAIWCTWTPRWPRWQTSRGRSPTTWR
jgi:hypothetical protein